MKSPALSASMRGLTVWYAIFSCVLLPYLLLTPAWAAEETELAYARGILAYGEGNYTAALDFFRQVVASEPDHLDALFYLGLSHSRLGQYAEAISPLATTLQRDPSRRYVHYHLGVAYAQTARYGAAVEHLEEAIVFDPNKAAAHFYLGYARVQLEHYEQALPPLQQAMTLDASLTPSVQYYRGLVFYAQERDAQARDAFETTLRSDPPATMAQNTQQYLQALDARARQQQLVQLQGSISFQYDDNVTIADDDIISREEDGRTVFTLTGRLIPVRTRPWRLGVEYGLFQSLHFDLSAFDIQEHTGRLFTDVNLDQVVLRLAAAYTYTLLDNERFSEAFTVEPSALIRQAAQFFAVLSMRYRDSNYFNQLIPTGQNAVRNRDGWSIRAGIDQFMTFNKQQSFVRLGYHFETSENTGSDWEYHSHRIGLGLQTPLWWHIMLHVDGSYTRFDYRHVHSFDASPPGILNALDQRKREDERFVFAVSLSHELGRYLILAVGYVHTTNMSNIDFFEYDRNVVALTLTGRY